jgi:glycogen debranching enzyme
MEKDTGFIHGGNQNNCGTWMDKMGSSEQTGNKGVPATPRDGAPIELTAMLYSSLRFMEELYELGIIDRKAVNVHSGELSFKEWADKI